MHRARYLWAASLAALTAVALLGAAATIRPPSIPADDDRAREATNQAVVAAFYEAVNLALATGNAQQIEAVTAAGYVERDAERGEDADRAALVRRLLAIRAAAPDLRLGVQAIAADGDVVIADVRVIGAAPETLLGLPVEPGWVPWGPVDVFRVEAGRIAERRGSSADPVPWTSALHRSLDLPAGPRSFTVARLTLAPGARYAPPRQDGLRLVLVDAGAVAVAVESDDAPATLRAGEHLLLPADAGFVADNREAAPAALYEIVIAPQPHPESAAGAAPPPLSASNGVSVQVLFDRLLVDMPSTPTILSLGQTTLAPGESLRWSEAAGPVMVHVATGTVDLAATGSVPWIRSVATDRSVAGGDTLLDAGGGALLETGGAVGLRAGPAVPATVLILTLVPAPATPSHA